MNKNKINYISQVDERDCGVAALSMVLAHYKTRLSLARLRDIAKTALILKKWTIFIQSVK